MKNYNTRKIVLLLIVMSLSFLLFACTEKKEEYVSPNKFLEEYQTALSQNGEFSFESVEEQNLWWVHSNLTDENLGAISFETNGEKIEIGSKKMEEPIGTASLLVVLDITNEKRADAYMKMVDQFVKIVDKDITSDEQAAEVRADMAQHMYESSYVYSFNGGRITQINIESGTFVYVANFEEENNN